MANDYRPMRRDPAGAMRTLRLKWLTEKPEVNSGAPESEASQVTRVLMDWPLADFTVTIVANSDGGASLYTTGTFGVIGGIKHEAVRAAAVRFVAMGRKYYDDAAVASDFAYPPAGLVRFYLVGLDGVRAIEADEQGLASRKHRFYALFNAGQDVMTALRLSTNLT